MKKFVLTAVCLIFSLRISSQETNVNDWGGLVSQAASLIANDPEAAEDAFEELLKGKNKKNVALLVDIGRAYLKEGEVEVAREYVDRAMKIDKTCAEVYVLSGDVALAQKNVNMASAEYSQAIYFDEDCSDAYLKYADVYQSVNPQLSIEMLLRLRAKKPDDSRIDKQLGKLYFETGEYGKAIEAYEDYMQAGVPEVQDYTHYATLLFLNKEFDESLTTVQKALSMDPDNWVLRRLSMYNRYEVGDYDGGLEDAEIFYAQPDSSDYVYLDYVYYGRLLGKYLLFDDALKQYELALALDSSKVEIHREISGIYEEQQDYPRAIASYRKYMDARHTSADMGELFLYGRLNYFAAADSTLKEQKSIYLSEADQTFARVSEYAPDIYLGSFWRARTNSLLDPETTEGLAKPYYEAALAILEQKTDASVPLVVECLSYLGYYYFVKEDYPTSKGYWERILQIDADNETAKAALEGMK